MFYGITDLTTFVLGTIFIVLLPGPNSLYVMAAASRGGLKAGYMGAAGIFTGDTILMILTAGGAASLLHSTPLLFTGLKVTGALYLGWLGIGLLLEARRLWAARGDDPAEAVALPPAERPYRTALLISLLNPKAILFFVSFFIQFVSPDYPHAGLSFLILGLIVQFFSVLYLVGLVHGGVTLSRRFRQHPHLAASGTGSVGLLFLGFGLKLAGASLAG